MINYTPKRITKVLGLIALIGLSGLLNAQTHSWAPAGPVYNAGRARNMIVDQSDSKILYVGSASSGIFKSKNGGISWYALNDQGTIRNISYLAQSTNGTIYAGTGEGFLRTGQKSKAQVGTGLYKLNPADSTLVQVVSSSIVGTVINRVACSPISPNHMAIATNMGIFWSTDGTTFNLATLPGAPTGSSISGQDLKFDSNGILYCSIGAEAGTATTTTASKIYKASDANFTTFASITPSSSVLSDNFYGRIELAIAPSDNNVIYASCANKYTIPSSATLKGLFVSYNAGVSWALITQGSAQLDPMSNGGTISSGDYAQAITVNPSNPHQLFFGSYLFYVWTRNNNSTTNPIGDWVQLGETFFANAQYYLHQNIHDIKFVSGNPAIFYFITDAGVYRSIDLAPLLPNLYANYTIGNVPSFQPFYQGLVTGQFNSVSIERYPIGSGVGSTTPGTQVQPNSGFIGGTGGNGLTYYSGTYSLVTTELSYMSGEVYNSEYSKILPNATFASNGNGDMYRSTNIKTSNPTVMNVNKYTNALSKIAPAPETFTNINVTTGTPFKLWEYYGQKGVVAPDSAVFYNDTIRYMASMSGTLELTTKTTFTFSTSRPNPYAIIDSVVIRTGTVSLPISNAGFVTVGLAGTPFNGPKDGQTIYARITPSTYSTISTPTVLSSVTKGPASGPVSFTLNPSTQNDNISVTFSAPPFSTKTITQYPITATGTNIVVPDAASYYRVFATVFYKYPAGALVTVIDNNVSTRTTTYTAVLANSLSWRYGNTLPAYTLSPTYTAAVTNPTYQVIPSATLVAPFTSTTLPIVVRPYGNTTYTIQQLGQYTVTGNPINYTVGIDPETYTITATVNPTLTSPIYTLNPGNITHTSNVFVVAPTSATGTTYTIQSGSGTSLTTNTFTFGPTSFSISPNINAVQVPTTLNVFAVSPTVTTTYTVSQTTNTLTLTTSSTIGTSTYVLNPGNVTQTNNPAFTVTVTAPTIYTIESISSNTLSIPSSTLTLAYPLSTTSVITLGPIPLNQFNPAIKIPSILSSRLAMILNNPSNTGSADAIVVSKNPLALNDPLSLIRVSQSGVYADDANGLATSSIVTTIVGKPTLLEWSKSGTEIYFATNSNKLYRVSHITTLMDLSPASYSGKFYTDVFAYAAPINNSTLNPVSPYRTTLIGSFDRPITSISVSNDNKNLAVSFNTSGTGTTSIVMYNTNDARISNATNINWGARQGTLPGTVNVTYCSLMEKNDSKKFFLGTDNGMFYTSDISTSNPNWSNVNDNSSSKLPSVQIFDIEQQVLDPWDCYNSGQIYVATNGRGVWTTGTYSLAYAVGIQENQKTAVEGKNMSLYPNPTNGNVNVAFNGVEGETATIQVMDISGRLVQVENLGKLNSGEVNYSFQTNTLNSGVYIVNISSDSGVKRVTKLIVTK